jgi:hypothetical protein
MCTIDFDLCVLYHPNGEVHLSDTTMEPLASLIPAEKRQRHGIIGIGTTGYPTLFNLFSSIHPHIAHNRKAHDIAYWV